MKTIFAIIGIFMLSFLTACGERIPPGHVGIKVDLYGSEKGVQLETLPPGWVWTGFTSTLYTFPTYEINFSFAKDGSDGSPGG